MKVVFVTETLAAAINHASANNVHLLPGKARNFSIYCKWPGELVDVEWILMEHARVILSMTAFENEDDASKILISQIKPVE